MLVTFYRDLPTAETAEAVLAHSTDDDRLELVGRELYWMPIGRMSDSVLDVKAIDRLLGVGTFRTLGTLAGIRKKLGG